MRRLIVAVSALCFVAVCMSCVNKAKQETEQQEEADLGITAEIRTDSITEVLVEFDNVRYSTTVDKSILLHNPTDTPLSLIDYDATCRCTWVDLPQKAIAPGEAGEVVLKFDSRGEYGSVGNYVDIRTSDPRCRIGIWMSAHVN